MIATVATTSADSRASGLAIDVPFATLSYGGVACRYTEDGMGIDLRAAAARYTDHCLRRGLARANVSGKRLHLRRYLDFSDAGGRDPLSADTLLDSMHDHRRRGLSVRTANFHRQQVHAWGAWLRDAGLIDDNPFKRCPSLDERGDRRYVRRALRFEEAERLIETSGSAVGPERACWYALGLYAGLRAGDTRRLRWSDVDLDAGVMTIRQGKSGRVETLPITPPLAELLAVCRRRRDERLAGEWRPKERERLERVCRVPHNSRRREDFKRAGIALVDDQGRRADFHCLRKTLHTMLVRAGVTPAICQRVMRHADYRTTLACYTERLDAEAAAALAKVFAPTDDAGPESGDAERWLAACPAGVSERQRAIIRLALGVDTRDTQGRDDEDERRDA